MPIYDQSYKSYSGLRKRSMLWFVISKQIAARATKGCLPKVTMAGQGIFVLVMSVLLFVAHKATDLAGENAYEVGRAARGGGLVWMNGDQSLATILYMILQFSTIPAFLLTMVTGGGSFSSDLRYNALPLYFSRPLHQREYIFGKLAGVALIPFLALALTVLLISLQYMAYFSDLNGFIREVPTIILALVYALGYSLFLALLIGGFSALCKSARNASGLFIGFFIVFSAMVTVLDDSPDTKPYTALSPIQALQVFAIKLFNPDLESLGIRPGGGNTLAQLSQGSFELAAVVLAVTAAVFILLLVRNVRSVEVVK